MKIQITKSQARQFLLKKQLLFPPQNLSGPSAIETVFNTLRVIQYDPLNPCGRNPDLVLQSRIQNYHPNDYENWLYTEKKGIEAYDKELCIIPIDDLAFTTHRNLRQINNKDKKKFLKKYQQEITDILSQIKTHGPITSSDIKFKQQVLSGWGSTAQFGRIALELLWKMGQLVVVKREGMKKYYDLIERAHPRLPEPFPLTEIKKEHILRRLKSVGILPKNTTGGGWQGLNAITPLIYNLVKSNLITELSVDGSNLTYLILSQDISQIQLPQTDPPKIMSFIAPLDNLIWDRLMIEDLFEFHYRWEVYTPISKRQFGYYCLPILAGNEFIGRIEPIKTREYKLEIKGLWQERKWNKNEYFAFNEALINFSNYLNTSEIINRFSPALNH